MEALSRLETQSARIFRARRPRARLFSLMRKLLLLLSRLRLACSKFFRGRTADKEPSVCFYAFARAVNDFSNLKLVRKSV